jgi:hypothetical protein
VLNEALTVGFLVFNVVCIVLILKPGKPPNKLTSYRPISLLPIVSKVFEKLLFKDSSQWLNITDLQFSFRQRLSTIDRTHRVVQKKRALENKQYCSSTQVKTVCLIKGK